MAADMSISSYNSHVLLYLASFNLFIYFRYRSCPNSRIGGGQNSRIARIGGGEHCKLCSQDVNAVAKESD